MARSTRAKTPGEPFPGHDEHEAWRDYGDGFAGAVATARLQGYNPNSLAYEDVAVDDAGSLSVTGIVSGEGGTGGAVTVANGADVALGNTADADTALTAIGLLKKIKALLSGTVTVTGAVTGPLTDTQLRATSVPVSDGGGTLSVDDGAGSLTVDGTVAATQSGTWNVVASDGSGSLTVDDGGTTFSVDDGGGSLTIDGSVTADTELTTADLDTGAGTDTRAVVGLVVAASGGAANVSNTNPVPISDAGGTVTVDDGSGSLTVDAPVGTPAFVRLSDGSAAISTLPISASALPLPSGAATNTVLTDGTQRVGGTVAVSIAAAVPITDNSGSLTVDDGSGSITVDAPVGTPAFVRLSDGSATLIGQKAAAASIPVVIASDQTVVDVTPTSPVGSDYLPVRLTDGTNFYASGATAKNPVSVYRSASEGIGTAATWKLMTSYPPPSGKSLIYQTATAGVTTAGTRTLICVGRKLGTFNTSTNAFTDGAAATSPNFFNRLFAVVTTALSATADTITVTYTNEAAASGKTTSGLAIPASALANNAFEFTLASGDIGVTDVTGISDSAAPTGIIEVWGVTTILESLGPALTAEEAEFTAATSVPDTDRVMILYNAAAITAQQRYAGVTGYLI